MNLYMFYVCVMYVFESCTFFVDADLNVSHIKFLIIHKQTSVVSIMVN